LNLYCSGSDDDDMSDEEGPSDTLSNTTRDRPSDSNNRYGTSNLFLSSLLLSLVPSVAKPEPYR
jgi:hypothetical protein